MRSEYPYTAAGTELDIILPDWAACGGRDAVLARLADPEQRSRIAASLDEERADVYWPTVMIGATLSEQNRRYRGLTVDMIANDMELTPGQAVVELLRRDKLYTGAFFFGMDEANMLPDNWPILRKALKKMGRSDLIGNGKLHLVPPRQPPKRHQRVKPGTRTFATQHTGLPRNPSRKSKR